MTRRTFPKNPRSEEKATTIATITVAQITRSNHAIKSHDQIYPCTVSVGCSTLGCKFRVLQSHPHKLSIRPPCGTLLTGGMQDDMSLIKPLR